MGKTISSKAVLNNSIEMPFFGLGVFKAGPGAEAKNADVFDFSISPEDMALLDDLNEDLRITWDPTDTP